MRAASRRPTPRVFFFGVDSLGMMDGSSVLPFPLMFGLGITPPLSVAVLGGFGCNLVGGGGGLCHAVMKGSLLVLAQR